VPRVPGSGTGLVIAELEKYAQGNGLHKAIDEDFCKVIRIHLLS